MAFYFFPSKMFTFGFIIMFQTAVEKLEWIRYISTMKTSARGLLQSFRKQEVMKN